MLSDTASPSLLLCTATPFCPPFFSPLSYLQQLMNFTLIQFHDGRYFKDPQSHKSTRVQSFYLPIAARMWNFSQLAFSLSQTSTHSQLQHPPSRCLLLPLYPFPSLLLVWVNLALSCSLSFSLPSSLTLASSLCLSHFPFYSSRSCLLLFFFFFFTGAIITPIKWKPLTDNENT